MKLLKTSVTMDDDKAARYAMGRGGWAIFEVDGAAEQIEVANAYRARIGLAKGAEAEAIKATPLFNWYARTDIFDMPGMIITARTAGSIHACLAGCMTDTDLPALVDEAGQTWLPYLSARVNDEMIADRRAEAGQRWKGWGLVSGFFVQYALAESVSIKQGGRIGECNGVNVHLKGIEATSNQGEQ